MFSGSAARLDVPWRWRVECWVCPTLAFDFAFEVWRGGASGTSSSSSEFPLANCRVFLSLGRDLELGEGSSRQRASSLHFGRMVDSWDGLMFCSVMGSSFLRHLPQEGDKFERTLLDGLSDTHSEVLSSGICLWVGNESKRTLLGGCPICPVTLSSSFFRHPSLGGKRIQKNCWMAIQSHSPVLPEQAGKWAQAVPVPRAQVVAGQPLDNASLAVWSVPGGGWELALTKEHPVLCQFWLDNRFLESM